MKSHVHFFVFLNWAKISTRVEAKLSDCSQKNCYYLRQDSLQKKKEKMLVEN